MYQNEVRRNPFGWKVRGFPQYPLLNCLECKSVWLQGVTRLAKRF